MPIQVGSGFNQEGTDIACEFVRITVFALIFRIVVSVYRAYLHADDHFVVPAFNGIILDVVVIVSIIVAYFTRSFVLAIGIVVAAFLQFVAMIPVVARRKKRIDFTLKGIFNSDTKKMFELLLPVLIGVGAHKYMY